MPFLEQLYYSVKAENWQLFTLVRRKITSELGRKTSLLKRIISIAIPVSLYLGREGNEGRTGEKKLIALFPACSFFSGFTVFY